jgi:acylphosphatase
LTSEERVKVLQSHLFVSVAVRGATFKDSARGKARSFGLSGWVRDTQNFRLEILFEGEPEDRRGTLAFEVATGLDAYCPTPLVSTTPPERLV